MLYWCPHLSCSHRSWAHMHTQAQAPVCFTHHCHFGRLALPPRRSFTLGQASRAHPCSRLGNCSTATPGCPRRPATACSALPATGRRVGGGNSGSGNSGACSGSHSRSNAHKLHLLTGYLAADIRGGCCSSTGSYSSGSSRCQSPAAAAAAAQGDEGLARGLSAIFARPLGCSTAPMAELVEVEDIAKVRKG